MHNKTKIHYAIPLVFSALFGLASFIIADPDIKKDSINIQKNISVQDSDVSFDLELPKSDYML